MKNKHFKVTRFLISLIVLIILIISLFLYLNILDNNSRNQKVKTNIQDVLVLAKSYKNDFESFEKLNCSFSQKLPNCETFAGNWDSTVNNIGVLAQDIQMQIGKKNEGLILSGSKENFKAMSYLLSGKKKLAYCADTNGIIGVTKKIDKYFLNFSPMNRYVEIPFFKNLPAKTIVIRAKVMQLTNNQVILNSIDSKTNTSSETISIDNMGYVNYVFKKDGQTNTLISTFPIISNQWFDLVITSSDTLQSIWLNGLEAGSSSVLGSIGLEENSLFLGRDNLKDTSSFDGLIEDVKIYNKILEESEIIDLHQDVLRGKSELVDWWKFDDASGLILTNAVDSNNNGKIINAYFENHTTDTACPIDTK